MPRTRFSFNSPLTLSLLLILRNSQATTYMLSRALSLPSNYVSRYLVRLRKLGLVERDDEGYWFLTEQGLKIIAQRIFVDDFIYSFKKIINENILDFNQLFKLMATKTLQKSYNKTTEKLQNYYINVTKIMNQDLDEFDVLVINAKKRLGRELDKAEEEILWFLYSYSSETGRKYWWPSTPGVGLAEALWEILGSSISIDEISQALRELESHGIIYITFDKRRQVPKIRIDRSLSRTND